MPENKLPTGPKPVLRINPKIALFYSVPKAGKTKLLSQLPASITLATEDGVEMYPMNYLRITSIDGGTEYWKATDAEVIKNPELLDQIRKTSLNTFYTMMEAEAARQIKAGEVLKFPYTFGCIDTIDELESFAEKVATRKYKESTIGKTFEGASVIELPKGSGYYHLRNEFMFHIEKLSLYFKYLILISHNRDKTLDKGGVSVETTDISLTGKLSSILAAKCDIIGYLYRDPGKTQMKVSFQTFGTGTMGARFDRLAGKTMDFDWKTIYIDEPALTPAV